LSKLIRSEIIVLADTWIGRDSNISYLQKSIRKITYNYFAKAFIGASKQTLSWYKHYNKNISSKMLFLSALCADNNYFNNYFESHRINKKYDMMYSGRIVDLKNPLFFAEVAKKVKKILGRCSVLIIGEGDEKLKADMFCTFEEHAIDYDFQGFVKHVKLPEYYAQAKILLLPTSGDCWGVVINEAMVSGVPVITTDMTAAAGELVLDGINGYVLPLDADLWTEKIVALLTDNKKLNELSEAAKDTVKKFNFDTAAEGIIKAIEYVENN
jgi:glycosyltransferase involved in cell wall biosynthesis